MPSTMRLPPDDSTIYDFGGEFLVECPRCAQRALVLDRGPAVQPRIALTCTHCGLSQAWEAVACGVAATTDLQRYVRGQVTLGAAVDWYFHRPLWLRVPCCGETLWAYNARHLDFLETYIGATLREHRRGPHGWRNQSLRNRLPRWMQQARHREEILRCIAALRAKD
jgi:hypothetical protein